MAKVVRDDPAAQDALAAELGATGKRGKVIAKVYSTGVSGDGQVRSKEKLW